MSVYTLYNTATGAIIASQECPDDLLPPVGVFAPDTALSVLHIASDPSRQFVSNGVLVEKPTAELDVMDDAANWLLFYRRRDALMAPTDHQFLTDYPVPTVQADIDARNALITRRQQSRDIPQNETDPVQALATLETLWSST
ncbi:MAG: hypothetical protein AAF727_13860 [Pseudomonadota bacterium]